MPQLPISLSATIIAKLDKIAQDENERRLYRDEEANIKASTIAARIVRENIQAYFRKGAK